MDCRVGTDSGSGAGVGVGGGGPGVEFFGGELAVGVEGVGVVAGVVGGDGEGGGWGVSLVLPCVVEHGGEVGGGVVGDLEHADRRGFAGVDERRERGEPGVRADLARDLVHVEAHEALARDRRGGIARELFARAGAVPLAVSVYENAVPVMPVALVALVMTAGEMMLSTSVLLSPGSGRFTV